MMTGLRRNWVPKILALIGAIALWFFVMKEQNPIMEVSYTVPVHAQNVSEKYIVDGLPDEVRVTLRGPRNSILALNQSSLKATADLGTLQEGQKNIEISFLPPPGLAVADITPKAVTITVDEYVVRELPLAIQQLGKLPEDMTLKEVTSVPKVVTVSGPKRLVNNVSHVYLPVRMDDRKTSFNANGAIVAVDDHGRVVNHISITPRQAQAKLELEQLQQEKVVGLAGSIVGTPATGYEIKSVTIQPNQVHVTGKESTLKELTEIRTGDILVDNVTKPFDGYYELVVPSGVTATPNRVHVIIDVARK